MFKQAELERPLSPRQTARKDDAARLCAGQEDQLQLNVPWPRAGATDFLLHGAHGLRGRHLQDVPQLRSAELEDLDRGLGSRCRRRRWRLPFLGRRYNPPFPQGGCSTSAPQGGNDLGVFSGGYPFLGRCSRKPKRNHHLGSPRITQDTPMYF